MAKQIKYKEEASRLIKAGVDKLANAVKATMGPKGRYVALSRKYGNPVITNDGVTIAKEIDLEDPFENIGAQLVKEVASKTNDIAGDGTTTATVLAQAIITEGLRNITAGANAVYIKRGIDLAVEEVIKTLKDMAKPVTDDTLEQIATISATDKEIGKLIAEVMKAVGKDGVITVEEGRSSKTETEKVQGMKFNRGFLSPYFITDPERSQVVYEDVAVILTDKKVAAIAEILPLLEKLLQTGNKPFIIIADDVEGEALATLVINKLKGTLKCVAIKSPSFGDKKKEMLEDIATLTGAQVISDIKGMKIEEADLTVVGSAKRVIVDKDNTTIIDGNGSQEALDNRVNSLRSQIANVETSSYDRETLQERLAKLSGGVALIKAGASTETEMKAKKYKIEDAINATRAGVEEGIVPGGGTALLRAAYILKSVQAPSADEQVGVNIIMKALQQPIKQIADNAGIDGASVVEKITANIIDMNYGFNADTLQYGNLIEQGVVDPVKVVRSALQNAASIAGLLLTTDVLVVEKPEPTDETH